MKSRTSLVAFVLSSILIIGGFMTSNNPKHLSKNPNPMKRYEVIATSDAPETWDSIGSYIGYEITNRECLPINSFLGQRDVPNFGIDIKMARVDERTWKGQFLRDAWQDADYYNRGICHWDVTSVSITATAKGVRFNWSHTLNTLLREGLQTSYFKKDLYGNPAAIRYGAQALTADDPEIARSPDAYFSVTSAVKEVVP